MYSYENGQLVQSESPYPAGPAGMSVLTQEVLVYGGLYSLFTMQADGSYRAENVAFPEGSAFEGITAESVTLRFENGLVSSAEIVLDSAQLGFPDPFTFSMVYTVSGVGTTTVNIPYAGA